ncbi:hypothetical protein BpHYR1_033302 [Brachionus plicatilis]|uniref:Uncharacterized protein n=1 Tax=Brachionus plicatilis TaxID=10195 RepID=A0A3M7S7E3_BRAPC|nr:hypothetical protein BpHYR1_033302 [Brachionus plicatilis]
MGNYKKNFHLSIETIFPLNEIKAKKFQKRGWFDSELTASSNERHFCYHNYMNCYDNEFNQNEYKEARIDADFDSTPDELVWTETKARNPVDQKN